MSAGELHPQTLKSAFELFNQQSSLLEASYRELRDKVASLTRELNESQSVRHRELLEKERLGDRLGRILETVPAAIILLDRSGIIVERNSVSTALLNRPLLGCAWRDVAKREFSNACADGELRLRDDRILSMARRPLPSDGGELLLLTDVTESRRTADLVQRQQRLSAIGEMTARLAHQIRTPLASALLYVSQLASNATPAGQVVAHKITGRLNELARMVNDMLQFAGGVRDSGERILIRDLFASVVDSLAPQVDARIGIELPDPRLTISGNSDALKAALLNVVNNAIEACGPAGKIELSAVSAAAQVYMSVTDNGHGIPKDVRERVFDPFFTTRPQGTGLGLAVVRSVVEAHRGEVLVSSDESGTTICLCLPTAAIDSPAARPASRAAQRARSSSIPNVPTLTERAHG